MSKQISAYTEPGCNYPAYYNLSKNVGEKVILTVRDSGWVHMAQVRIPNDALERMAQDIFRYLGIESWEDEQLRTELSAANAEIERLKGEEVFSDLLREKLSVILTNTANALKGKPDELSLHSWHDLAEVAHEIVAERDKLLAEDRKKAVLKGMTLANDAGAAAAMYARKYHDILAENEKLQATVKELSWDGALNDAVAKIAELERKVETADMLYDSAYIAGMKHGWNSCVENDSVGFEKAIMSRINGKVEFKRKETK